MRIGTPGRYYLRLFNNAGQAISPFLGVEEQYTVSSLPYEGHTFWLGLFDDRFQLLDTRLLVRE